MKTYGLYESAAVKIQTLKTAIEVCCFLFFLLRFQKKTDFCFCSRRRYFFGWTTWFLPVGQDRRRVEEEASRRWVARERATISSQRGKGFLKEREKNS